MEERCIICAFAERSVVSLPTGSPGDVAPPIDTLPNKFRDKGTLLVVQGSAVPESRGIERSTVRGFARVLVVAVNIYVAIALGVECRKYGLRERGSDGVC